MVFLTKIYSGFCDFLDLWPIRDGLFQFLFCPASCTTRRVKTAVFVVAHDTASFPARRFNAVRMLSRA